MGWTSKAATQPVDDILLSVTEMPKWVGKDKLEVHIRGQVGLEGIIGSRFPVAQWVEGPFKDEQKPVHLHLYAQNAQDYAAAYNQKNPKQPIEAFVDALANARQAQSIASDFYILAANVAKDKDKPRIMHEKQKDGSESLVVVIEDKSGVGGAINRLSKHYGVDQFKAEHLKPQPGRRQTDSTPLVGNRGESFSIAPDKTSQHTLYLMDEAAAAFIDQHNAFLARTTGQSPQPSPAR
jgi:hypothetical protein